MKMKQEYPIAAKERAAGLQPEAVTPHFNQMAQQINGAAVQASAVDLLGDLLHPKGPSLKDFVLLLKKRRKLISYTALSIFLLGAIYIYFAPDQFTAISTLEIKGYAPVLGEGEVETLLQNDTRKNSYLSTTTAKITHLSVADRVLEALPSSLSSDGEYKGNLAEAIRKYFRKNRPLYGKVSAAIKRYFVKREDSHFDEDDPRFTHRQSFINSYLRLIQVRPIHETSLVELRVTTTDRRLSQRIANEHAEGFIRFLADERRGELKSHLDVLGAHAGELQKKLADVEAEVAKYSQDHKLVGLVNGAQGNLMLSNLTELNKTLSAVQERRVKSGSKLQKISEGQGGERVLLDDETVRNLRTRLKEAESEYSALSRLVTAEYPKLVELQGKIDSLRGIIREEREGSLLALRTQYQSDVAAEQMLVKQFEDQLSKAHEMSKELVQYDLLQREATSLRDLTQTVLKALNETKIGASSSRSNVFITDFAPLPRSPSAPRRKIVMIFSMLLGVVAGVGLAVLREVLDNTIKVSDDAQVALGIPTLGIIPSFKALGAPELIDREQGFWSRVLMSLPDGLRSRLQKSALSEALRLRVVAMFAQNSGNLKDEESEGESEFESSNGTSSEVDPLAHSLAQDNSGEAEPSLVSTDSARAALMSIALPEAGILDALRTLRANILFSTTQNQSRVIMVASAREREGKTSVITNLAVTFARASQRTLLIDGDLRRPKVSRRLGLDKNVAGLVDYLADQAPLDEVVHPGPVPYLAVLPAGSPTVDPTELLGSEKMKELVEVLRGQFDVILIDAAPVLPVADSLMLSQLAETIIFVVRSGRTEKAVAQEAVRRLRRVGAKIRGVVLNDFDPGESSYSSDRYSVSRYEVVSSTASAKHFTAEEYGDPGASAGQDRSQQQRVAQG